MVKPNKTLLSNRKRNFFRNQPCLIMHFRVRLNFVNIFVQSAIERNVNISQYFIKLTLLCMIVFFCPLSSLCSLIWSFVSVLQCIRTICVKEYNHQSYTVHNSCPWSGSVITWKPWYTLCAFQVKMQMQAQKIVQAVSEPYHLDVNCLLSTFGPINWSLHQTKWHQLFGYIVPTT